MFKRFKAFTLAEVLITLGIIGVVAAITMPSVIAKHQKQVTVSRLKKAYTTLSQMVLRSSVDNGSASEFLSMNELPTEEKTKEFFETYWLPYFNNPNVATKKSFYDKNSPFKLLNSGDCYEILVAVNYSMGRILFSTQDGTIYYSFITAWVYDENGNNTGTSVYKSLQDVYVDINGTKAPNTFGKDVFNFIVDFQNGVVKPADGTCNKKSNGFGCAKKIMQDGWQIKDDYPW